MTHVRAVPTVQIDEAAVRVTEWRPCAQRRHRTTGTPPSPCFRMSTIWLSVNRDFRMGIS